MHPGDTERPPCGIDRGIRVMGIDACGWDKPFDEMIKDVRAGKKENLWAAHFAGKEKEYCHIENWVEKVHAAVVLKKGAELSEQDLMDFCEQRLARFKAPKSVEFVDALAKNPSGKYSKGR